MKYKMTTDIEIKYPELFSTKVAKLYHKYYKGTAYRLANPAGSLIESISSNGTYSTYDKDSDIYKLIINEFIIGGRYDTTILVCDYFIVNPRKFKIGRYNFSYNSGVIRRAGDYVGTPLNNHRVLDNNDFDKHGLFILDYDLLLLRHAFENSHLISDDDGNEILGIYDMNAIPLEIFFPKEYEHSIETFENHIEFQIEHHASVRINSENNMLINISEGKGFYVDSELIKRIEYFTRKFS